jgi:hypothetical protein
MKIMNGLDLQSQKITNLADPSAATDAANRQFVENIARGMQWKDPVRAATTANGALASAYANGQSIDGVTLATGDRILIKDQTTASENGIYTVNASGAPTRAVDADTTGELKPGTTVLVTEGTVNGDKSFGITSNAAITIGTTAMTWGQIGGGGSSYSGGNGINVTGSTISAVAAPSGGVTVGGTGIALDNSIAARKFSANIGNGSATSIAVTHNLGTQDVTWSLREVATNAFVQTDAVATDANTLTISFAVAPASNALRVAVQG